MSSSSTPPTRPVPSRPTASCPSPPRSTRPTPTVPTATVTATSSSTTTVTPRRAATRPAAMARRRSTLTTFKQKTLPTRHARVCFCGAPETSSPGRPSAARPEGWGCCLLSQIQWSSPRRLLDSATVKVSRAVRWTAMVGETSWLVRSDLGDDRIISLRLIN
ncbi:hypothetical protein CCHR01_13868 [Colletotrichum chrysophilum]|uniref:Uncharacterized protein n=1 Tax=Colletotrichum chrysophilum TaxID=1836956 RepID=A0AAD9A8N3_9PEZI|nr:hypothetical protein CCHR01_13868 [Colletotrichum chrysophilum]